MKLEVSVSVMAANGFVTNIPIQKKNSFQVKNCLASLQAEQHRAQNSSEIAPVTLLLFYYVGEYFPINYFYGTYLHTIQFPPLSIRFLCP